MLMLASVAAGWTPRGAEAQPQWTVLVCLDTRQGLAEAADGYQQRLATVCRVRGFPLAALRLGEVPGPAGTLTVRLLLLDKTGWRERRTQASPTVAEAVGAAAERVFRWRPGRHALLVVVGHGRGLLEPGTGMDAAGLGRALIRAQAARGAPVDVVGLDTCFGGSLETLWELRANARYAVAAPGLVYAPGLRWDEALRMATDDPRELAVRVTRLGMQGGTRGAGLVAADMASLPAVAERVASLTEMLRTEMKQVGPAVTLARSRAGSWGRREELADVGEFTAALALNAPDDMTKTAAESVTQALRSCLVAQWPSGGEPGRGVGVYFPRTVEAVPAPYAELGFAGGSGWHGFLQAYWEWVSSLVAG